VAFQANPLVAGRQKPATRCATEPGTVRRERRSSGRVGGMAGEAALLAVARSTSADVALGGQRMAVRSRRRDRSAAGVARPARRMERLHAGAGAERVVRTATGQTALGIGPDARSLVASDAERLCRAVAG